MIPNKPNPHNQFTRAEITDGFSKVFTVDNAILEETAAGLLSFGAANVTRGSRWVLIGWAWGPYWR